MSEPKKLREREKELQELLASPAGKVKLKELESKYLLLTGNRKPTRASIITYIIVSERALGLIDQVIN